MSILVLAVANELAVKTSCELIINTMPRFTHRCLRSSSVYPRKISPVIEAFLPSLRLDSNVRAFDP